MYESWLTPDDFARYLAVSETLLALTVIYPMSYCFHSFPRLPTELRLIIWQKAIRTERHRHYEGRIIELHSYNALDSTISVSISKRYPAVFAANTESRTEAVKLFGGEFMTLYAGYNGARAGVTARPYRSKPLAIYINYSKDTLFISMRFELSGSIRHWSRPLLNSRLRNLRVLLPAVALSKVTKLQLSIDQEYSIAELLKAWSGHGILTINTPALQLVCIVGKCLLFTQAFRLVVAQHCKEHWERHWPGAQPPSTAATVTSDSAISVTQIDSCGSCHIVKSPGFKVGGICTNAEIEQDRMTNLRI